ncbi:extracellular solute-binding protein [Alteribacillus sp. HJP-4]|uniref:extracellular solute-binding protein n=1 Tax=Alteribacillus sp. HJP-4 TaxID=2775394 RepID=UPI0035CD21CB
MKRKHFIFTLLAVFTASVSLAGCSDSGDSASGSNDSVTVWAMGEEGKQLEELTAGFEEETDIAVDVQSIPWESAHDKLLTAVASGNGPDVLQLGTSWVPEFANAGALLDLTEYVEDYPNFEPDNYFDGAVESMTYDDQVVGVPWYVETRTLFYRTDLLAEVGYDEAPATWDELKDAATKLSESGDDVYGLDIAMDDPIMPFMFAWQNGSEFINEEKETNFDTEEFDDGIEYYTSFFEEGISSTSEGMEITRI